jgi:hypothetical protein
VVVVVVVLVAAENLAIAKHQRPNVPANVSIRTQMRRTVAAVAKRAKLAKRVRKEHAKDLPVAAAAVVEVVVEAARMRIPSAQPRKAHVNRRPLIAVAALSRDYAMDQQTLNAALLLLAEVAMEAVVTEVAVEAAHPRAASMVSLPANTVDVPSRLLLEAIWCACWMPPKPLALNSVAHPRSAAPRSKLPFARRTAAPRIMTSIRNRLINVNLQRRLLVLRITRRDSPLTSTAEERRLRVPLVKRG